MSRFVIACDTATTARPVSVKSDATVTATFDTASWTVDASFVGFDASTHVLPTALHVYSVTEGSAPYTTADEYVASSYPHSATAVVTADMHKLPNPTDLASVAYVIAEYPI